ncbi:DUF6867 family protein [Xanthobacter sediminis]|uniref:DUF6867 family protein n=1 Tax=Xanthobacter sediminis TaxID=3119926 RepID=UPI00372C6CF5
MARDPGNPSSPLLVVPLVLIALFVLAAALAPQEVTGGSLGDFLLVSLVMGGSAAWLTGKAVARAWRSPASLALYCVPLAAAVRFCHFALFADDLFSPAASLAEIVFLFAVAALGFRAVRRRQMSVQYGWMFAPAGPLCWRRLDGDEAADGPPGP